TYVTRADYLSPFFNELAYCLGVERLLGVEAPERATLIRVLVCELNRITSHLVWLATSGLELGAVSVMLYGFREREVIMEIFEATVRTEGDAYARYVGRLSEMRESLKIARQALERIEETPGPVMIDDPKVGWPPRLSVGPDGIGNDPEYLRHIMEESMEALIH